MHDERLESRSMLACGEGERAANKGSRHQRRWRSREPLRVAVYSGVQSREDPHYHLRHCRLLSKGGNELKKETAQSRHRIVGIVEWILSSAIHSCLYPSVGHPTHMRAIHHI